MSLLFECVRLSRINVIFNRIGVIEIRIRVEHDRIGANRLQISTHHERIIDSNIYDGEMIPAFIQIPIALIRIPRIRIRIPCILTPDYTFGFILRSKIHIYANQPSDVIPSETGAASLLT